MEHIEELDLELFEGIAVPENLNELLREAATKELSSEERRAQRVSFVIAMLPRDIEMSREAIEERLGKIYG